MAPGRQDGEGRIKIGSGACLSSAGIVSLGAFGRRLSGRLPDRADSASVKDLFTGAAKFPRHCLVTFSSSIIVNERSLVEGLIHFFIHAVVSFPQIIVRSIVLSLPAVRYSAGLPPERFAGFRHRLRHFFRFRENLRIPAGRRRVGGRPASDFFLYPESILCYNYAVKTAHRATWHSDPRRYTGAASDFVPSGKGRKEQ